MTASHRADEITFYEELGVSPAASPEEIRDAFRTLVRMLHPDRQTDAQLKEVAEKQMRKLNRIYAVLSDPERRRLYDEAPDDDGPEVAAGRPLKPGVVKAAGRMGWLAAISLSVAMLIWLASEAATPGPQSRVRDQNGPATGASSSGFAGDAGDQESLIASLRSDLGAVTRQRDAAIRELSQLRGTAGVERSTSSAGSGLTEIKSPAIALTELPSAPKLPVFADFPPSRLGNAASPKLGGVWYYVKLPPGQHYKSEGRYPPEYIEATISERNGTISGKYRARFRIVDRAISPNVNFTFTGTSSADPLMTGTWTGPGGAEGKLTLRFTSANSLRIDWTATALGTEQGLDADIAILTRRID